MRGFVTEEESPLRQLELIDPALATSVIAVLAEKQGRFSLKDLSLLADETLWAFSLDIMFGEIVAAGYARLIGEVPTERLLRYRDETRKAGSYGLNLGRMMADYLVPVLHHGSDAFGEQFLALVRTLRGRGEYIMKKPLSLLSVFLNAGAQEAAWEFLRLLGDAYAGDIPYKRGLRLAHLLPKAIQGFSPSRRCWQMVQIRRILRADTALADPFMAAMDKGLGLLSEAALGDFISLGLEKFGRNPEMGTRFLALASESGLNAWSDRMVTVPLTQVREPLRRYLRARTGRTIAIRPLSAIPKTFFPDGAERPLVCSDGQAIYLPDEIGLAERREENSALYKCLTRLESAHYEFGTFEFDSERAARQYGVPLPGEGPENRSDLERFFQSFPRPALAADLFAVFEQGRIRLRMAETYPGMVRQTFPVLIREMGVMSEFSFPERLYCRIGLGAAPDDDPPFVRELADRFEMAVAADARVETCAGLVFGCYSEAERHFCTPGETPYRPLQIPFGRRVRPDLFLAGFQHFDKMAGQVRVRLAEKGLKAYKSDIRKQLIDNSGTLSPADLKEIVFSRDNGTPGESRGAEIDLSWLDLSELTGQPGADTGTADTTGAPVFRYREWDMNLGDYLPDHTRVSDRFVSEIPGDVYAATLGRHPGIVSRIRYAFELLKPEGLNILRQWVEGDEFDYRALLDFAVDRKAGIMPSDRLYIKRIKQDRDVAVLLLVDLSGSTANTVFGTDASVLDLEKEAIVLFCEALQVVGDAFAIAGFSGTGRLGVDYFRIKDFDAPVDGTVQARISGMAPQRSTRMGAAIRHATAQLEGVAAKVRILIILGDGFPNDTDYKREYAIADTRKSVAEARAKNIHARAITVNITGDSRLDDLYGSLHHNVISDVRELPDKLLRIYSALTR